MRKRVNSQSRKRAPKSADKRTAKSERTAKRAPKHAEKPVVEHCDFCGDPIKPNYGTTRCPRCGEVKCVESCIPSGANTVCVACEEAEEYE